MWKNSPQAQQLFVFLMFCREYILHTKNLGLNAIVIYRIYNWNCIPNTECSHALATSRSHDI